VLDGIDAFDIIVSDAESSHLGALRGDGLHIVISQRVAGDVQLDQLVQFGEVLQGSQVALGHAQHLDVLAGFDKSLHGRGQLADLDLGQVEFGHFCRFAVALDLAFDLAEGSFGVCHVGVDGGRPDVSGERYIDSSKHVQHGLSLIGASL
jgi:hypothetical protein